MKPFCPLLRKPFKFRTTNFSHEIRSTFNTAFFKFFSPFLIILFSGYFSFGQYNVNGNAVSLGGDCFRLTPAAPTQGGSVWFQNKISLASDLTIHATINLGNRSGTFTGADGIAFVLQPVCSGIGGVGGGIGYQGITPSLDVEFDTWQNGDQNDPGADHVGLMKNGNVTHNGPTAAPIQVLQNYRTVGELEDGANHDLLIQWTASTQNLKVTLDGTLQVNYTDNIVATIFGGNRNVFWGFTAATGTAFNNQSVCILSKSFTEEGSYTVTNATCPNYNNGAINLNPAGGVGPFTYSWSNGATTEDVSGLSAGTYSVTVTDGNGCKSIYNNIVVANELDAEGPVITCPGNLSVFNDPGECSAVVPFGITPVVNYDPTGPQLSATPNPPDFQATGVTATDLSQVGLENSGNANVWPVGRITSSPTIVTGEYVTFSVSVPGGTDFANLVYDKYSYLGNGASKASVRSSLDGFASDIVTIPVNPSGFQRLTFDVSSLPNVSGNIEFRIYFYGAPADRVDYDDLESSFYGGTGLTLNRYLTATATDNCPAVTVAGVRSDALPLSSPYPIGITTITWTATDASSNTASCLQTVTVTDNERPTLNNVPADATVECNAVPSGSAPVTASDNCSTTLNYYTTPTIKTKLVHHWKADGNYNDAVGGANGTPTGSVTFGPGIIGSNSFSFDGTTGYISTGTAGSVSGTGNFAVSAWIKTTGTGPMVIIQQRDNNFVGEYILKVGGNHFNGDLRPGKVYFLAFSGDPAIDLFSTTSVNDGKWHQVVAERDGSNIRIYIDGILDASGSTGVPVTFDNTISTTIGRDVRNNNSNFNGLIDDIKVWSTPACPSAYEFDRVWTATDASGNQSAAIQHVTVQDNTAPVLTCPGNISVSNTSGKCGANVSYTATATDNCSTATIVYSIAPGSFFTVGTTTVTVTATDECGKQSTCNFTVTVTDTEKPNAVCKNAAVTLSGGTASITAADINNGSTDNCGIKSVSVSPNTFTCSNIGPNTVTLTVTDNNNNVSTCMATVTVVGEVPSCTITSIPSNGTYTGGVPTNLYIGYGPQSTTLQVSTPASGAPYTYAWSGGTLSNYNTANPVFTATTPGSFTFTVQVTNKFGCKSTCSITICVLDVRVPGTDGKKVYVCHTPPGNPGNAHTLSISVNAVSAHIFNPGHGDHLGTCEQTPCASAPVASFVSTVKGVINNEDLISAFQVTVSPNPTMHQFSFNVRSNVNTPVSIRLFNSMGQVVDGIAKVNANSTVNLGAKLQNGAYMAEVIQGNNRKMISLIKLN